MGYEQHSHCQPNHPPCQPNVVALTGRPERDTCISKDDILNLRILLETTKDVNEFIQAIS